MPLIEWILLNLQNPPVSARDIEIGGTSIVASIYNSKAKGGVIVKGIANNYTVIPSCKLFTCKNGVPCFHHKECSCNTSKFLPPAEGLAMSTAEVKTQKALLPANVICGRKDIYKTLNRINNYFTG